MADPQHKPSTFEDFVAWECRQDTRHEFVGGEVRAMVGGTQAHNAVQGNVYVATRTRLRGSGCRSFTSDMLMRTGHDNGRYPDVTIDCGPFVPDARVASQPTVVFEVLSPTTQREDRPRKLADYAATPSIAHYVLIEIDEPLVYLYSRGEHGVFSVIPREIGGLDGTVDLPAVGITLPTQEIYEGITFLSHDDGAAAGG